MEDREAFLVADLLGLVPCLRRTSKLKTVVLRVQELCSALLQHSRVWYTDHTHLVPSAVPHPRSRAQKSSPDPSP